MFKNPTHNLLSKKNDFFVEKLSVVLANTYLIYLKTQNYHWNIEGPNFYMLHKFLNEQYLELAIAVDEIAERIRSLEAVSPGSFNEFLRLTTLSDNTHNSSNSDDMLYNLLKDHILIVADLKTTLKIAGNYDDEASKDLLIKRLSAHEKIVWMIRSHLSPIQQSRMG